MRAANFVKKTHNKEVMKEYSLEQLQRKGTIKMSLGEIVAMKNMALKMHFEDLVARLRIEEQKILSKK